MGTEATSSDFSLARQDGVALPRDFWKTLKTTSWRPAFAWSRGLRCGWPQIGPWNVRARSAEQAKSG